MVDLTRSKRLSKFQKDPKRSKIPSGEFEDSLKSQFEAIHPRPSWAHKSQDTISSILTKPHELVSETVRLFPDIIEMRRLPNPNIESPSTAPITSVRFHPNTRLLMAAGQDSQIRLFGCENNNLVSSFEVPKFRIFCAEFLGDGRRVLGGGSRPHLNSVDLETGKIEKVLPSYEQSGWRRLDRSPSGERIALLGSDGKVRVLSSSSRQVAATVIMPGVAKCASFSPDSNYMLTAGSDPKIYLWDIRKSSSCVHAFQSSVGNVCTRLSWSSDNTKIAAGSNLGVVDIFDASNVNQGKLPLERSLYNLTTYITELAFHPSSQLLAFGSNELNNSLRIAHIASGRVYSNWPTVRQSLRHVTSIDMTEERIVVGNDRGAVTAHQFNAFK